MNVEKITDHDDLLIARFVHEKTQLSQSRHTQEKYVEVASSWMTFLRRHGLTLASSIDELAEALQIFCAHPRSLYQQTVTPSTFRLRHSIVSSLYDALIRWRVSGVTSNPARLVLRPANVTTYAAHSLSEQEFIEIYRRLDGDSLLMKRDRAIFAVAVTTAMRITALKDLTIGDINVRYRDDNKEIYDVLVFVKRQKGGYADQYSVPYPFSLAVTEYLVDAYGEWRNHTPVAPLWLTMSSNYKDYPMSERSFRNMLKRYTGETKMHTLRKTAAEIAKRNGASLLQIQKLLRHKNPTTTMRYIDTSDIEVSELFHKLAEKVSPQ